MYHSSEEKDLKLQLFHLLHSRRGDSTAHLRSLLPQLTRNLLNDRLPHGYFSDDTPVMICCRYGYLEKLIILIKEGNADPNGTNVHGVSPLWLAFKWREEACADFLISVGGMFCPGSLYAKLMKADDRCLNLILPRFQQFLTENELDSLTTTFFTRKNAFCMDRLLPRLLSLSEAGGESAARVDRIVTTAFQNDNGAWFALSAISNGNIPIRDRNALRNALLTACYRFIFDVNESRKMLIYLMKNFPAAQAETGILISWAIKNKKMLLLDFLVDTFSIDVSQIVNTPIFSYGTRNRITRLNKSENLSISILYNAFEAGCDAGIGFLLRRGAKFRDELKSPELFLEMLKMLPSSHNPKYDLLLLDELNRLHSEIVTPELLSACGRIVTEKKLVVVLHRLIELGLDVGSLTRHYNVYGRCLDLLINAGASVNEIGSEFRSKKSKLDDLAMLLNNGIDPTLNTVNRYGKQRLLESPEAIELFKQRYLDYLF